MNATTRLVVSPGVDRREWPFELLWSEDYPDQRPLTVKPFFVPATQAASGYVWDPHVGGYVFSPLAAAFLSRHRESLLAPLSSGVACFRLYCPRAEALGTVFLVGPGLAGVGEVGYPVNPARWHGFSGGSVGEVQRGMSTFGLTRSGRRREIVEEEVSFRGDAEKRLRWGYDSPRSEPVTATPFLGGSGKLLPCPQPVAGDPGLLRAGEPCWGDIRVRYEAEYTPIRVAYDLGVTGREADRLRVDWVQAGVGGAPVVWPRILLAAVSAQHRVATALAERRVAPVSAHPLATGTSSSSTTNVLYTLNQGGAFNVTHEREGVVDAAELVAAMEAAIESALKKAGVGEDQVLTESSRDHYETMRIASEEDPEVYVDFRTPRTIVFTDGKGRQVTHRYAESSQP